jgi:hypothetical protein
MKGAHGYLTGYNAQAVADSGSGLLVGLDVQTNAADQQQLLPMLDATEATTGRMPTEVVADTGYYSGANVAGAPERGVTLFAPLQPPSTPQQDPTWRYHASQFTYDPATDTFTCPQGRPLLLHGRSLGARPGRVYRGVACTDCAVRGACTPSPRGRTVVRYPWDGAVAAHRHRMATPEARARLRQRRQVIEPIFGTIKEHLGLRRFAVRGLHAVQAEWKLTGAAFNLWKLYRYWWRPQVAELAGG